MGTLEGLRIVATVIGGGFLGYAALAVFRGTLYDVDEGRMISGPVPWPSGSRWPA